MLQCEVWKGWGSRRSRLFDPISTFWKNYLAATFFLFLFSLFFLTFLLFFFLLFLYSLFLIISPFNIVNNFEYKEDEKSECNLNKEYSLIVVYIINPISVDRVNRHCIIQITKKIINLIYLNPLLKKYKHISKKSDHSIFQSVILNKWTIKINNLWVPIRNIQENIHLGSICNLKNLPEINLHSTLYLLLKISMKSQLFLNLTCLLIFKIVEFRRIDRNRSKIVNIIVLVLANKILHYLRKGL